MSGVAEFCNMVTNTCEIYIFFINRLVKFLFYLIKIFLICGLHSIIPIQVLLL